MSDELDEEAVKLANILKNMSCGERCFFVIGLLSPLGRANWDAFYKKATKSGANLGDVGFQDSTADSKLRQNINAVISQDRRYPPGSFKAKTTIQSIILDSCL